MIFRLNFWCSANPVAMRLARQIFDQQVIPNQFRGAYVKEMASPFLRKSGWRYAANGRNSWDFEHSDGCCLKVMQSAARQTWSEKHLLDARPVFDIRPKGGQLADVFVVAWHPVIPLNEVDHRDPEQWQLFLLPTRALPQDQKTIGLKRLGEIAAQHGGGPVSFSALAGAVEGLRLRLRAEDAVRANGRIPGSQLNPAPV